MKRIFLFVALLLGGASLPARAQAPAGNAMLDFLSGYGPARIEFTVQGKAPDGTRIDAMRGTMEVQYPGFRIHAADNLIVGDDTVLWYYSKGTSEVLVMESFLKELVSGAVWKSDASGRRTVSFRQADGTDLTFTVLSMERVPDGWNAGHFRLDTDALGDDVIVTDIR